MEVITNETDIKKIENLLKIFFEKINKNPDTEDYTNEKLVTFISELSDLESRRDEFPKKIEDKESEISEKQRELEGFNTGEISFDKLNHSIFNDISLKSFLTSNGELDNISNIFERIQEGKDTVLEKLSGSLKSLEEELKNIKEDEKNLVDKISEIKKAINLLKNQIRLAENLFKKVEDNSIINESPGKVIEVLKNIDFSDEEAKLIANLLQYNQELVIQYKQSGVLSEQEEKASIGSIVNAAQNDAKKDEEDTLSKLRVGEAIDFSTASMGDIYYDIYGDDFKPEDTQPLADITNDVMTSYSNNVPDSSAVVNSEISDTMPDDEEYYDILDLNHTGRYINPKGEYGKQESSSYVEPEVTELKSNSETQEYPLSTEVDLVGALKDSGLILLEEYEYFIKENCDVDTVINNLGIAKDHGIRVDHFLGTKKGILTEEEADKYMKAFFVKLGKDKEFEQKLELLKNYGHQGEEMTFVLSSFLDTTIDSINENFIGNPTNRELSYLLNPSDTSKSHEGVSVVTKTGTINFGGLH